MRKPILVVMAVILVLTLATIAVAADPFVGTWKLNVAKSKSTGPAPKSEIFTITAQGGGFKWASESVAADGKATNAVWSGKYDGKDYSLTENADFDTVASKRVGANTLDAVLKKGGKVVGSIRWVVSKDGKTLTLTEKLKNAQGQEINDVGVLDKQ